MAMDFEHTSQAEGRRGTKAIQLARYLWDRVVPRPTCCHYGRNSFADLRGGWAFIRHVWQETCYGTASLPKQKTRWARAEPEHPAAARARMTSGTCGCRRRSRSRRLMGPVVMENRRMGEAMSDAFILGVALACGVGVLGLVVALFWGAEPSRTCRCVVGGHTEACDARWS